MSFADYPGKAELPVRTRRNYEPFTDPLYRAEICRVPDGTYLDLSFFHVVSDGVLLQIFMDDVTAVYEGKLMEKEIVSGFELTTEKLESVMETVYHK